MESSGLFAPEFECSDSALSNVFRQGFGTPFKRLHYFRGKLHAMKYVLITFCLFNSLLHAQDAAGEVQRTIEKFFEGFHQKDSNMIMQTVKRGAILQTIATAKNGENILRTEDFNDFLRSITGIPDSVKFKEVINDYRIRVDGPMASAWTPYEFWLNEQFSHCGVNSFHLVQQQGEWKIIYLIDTRRKENCP